MDDRGREEIERSLPGLPLPPVHARRDIDAALRRANVPGMSITVMRAGEVAWSAGYGATRATGGAAVTPETIFQACSISKAVAALGVLRLVQEGRLDLDQDVNRYLTTWTIPANGDWQPRVTLRQLLSHSAALTHGWYPGYLNGEPLPSLRQILDGKAPAKTAPVRVSGVPGFRFLYAGSHFTVIQQLLEDVAETPFAELMRALVLAPLAMRRSSYDQRFPERAGESVAAGHNEMGDPVEGDWRLLPEMAAAGLWTTSDDLAAVMLEIHRAATGGAARILDRPIVAEMLSRQCGHWGLGWQVSEYAGRRFAEHSGSNIGYRCRALIDVERGDGIVVMTNGNEGGSVIADVIAAATRTYGWPLPAAREAILRQPPEHWPRYAADAAREAALAGDFLSATGTRFAIVARDGLFLSLPGQPPLGLQAIDATTYAARQANVLITFHESADAPSDCTVHVDGVTIEARRG